MTELSIDCCTRPTAQFNQFSPVNINRFDWGVNYIDDYGSDGNAYSPLDPASWGDFPHSSTANLVLTPTLLLDSQHEYCASIRPFSGDLITCGSSRYGVSDSVSNVRRISATTGSVISESPMLYGQNGFTDGTGYFFSGQNEINTTGDGYSYIYGKDTVGGSASWHAYDSDCDPVSVPSYLSSAGNVYPSRFGSSLAFVPSDGLSVSVIDGNSDIATYTFPSGYSLIYSTLKVSITVDESGNVWAPIYNSSVGFHLSFNGSIISTAPISASVVPLVAATPDGNCLIDAYGLLAIVDSSYATITSWSPSIFRYRPTPFWLSSNWQMYGGGGRESAGVQPLSGMHVWNDPTDFIGDANSKIALCCKSYNYQRFFGDGETLWICGKRETNGLGAGEW